MTRRVPVRRETHHRAVPEHVVLAIDQPQFMAEVKITAVEAAACRRIRVHTGLPLAELGDLPATMASVSTQAPTMFVVDDDSAVREAMRDLLQEDGRTVEIYASSEAFLEAYRPGGEGCLLVDAQMPGMGGLALLQRLQSEGTRLPAIMITGQGACRRRSEP
jgi:two-component system CheB/CheR fusion protein